MDRFEEVKIKIVMKSEKVSRARARAIIAQRGRRPSGGTAVKACGSISSDDCKDDPLSGMILLDVC